MPVQAIRLGPCAEQPHSSASQRGRRRVNFACASVREDWAVKCVEACVCMYLCVHVVVRLQSVHKVSTGASATAGAIVRVHMHVKASDADRVSKSARARVNVWSVLGNALHGAIRAVPIIVPSWQRASLQATHPLKPGAQPVACGVHSGSRRNASGIVSANFGSTTRAAVPRLNDTEWLTGARLQLMDSNQLGGHIWLHSTVRLAAKYEHLPVEL